MWLAQMATCAPWRTYMGGWMTREESWAVWGSPSRNNLAAKVGPKVTQVQSPKGHKSQT